MTTRPYVFEITRVDKVLDGDTFDLVVDVGFKLYATIRVRLLGFDTPERSKGSDFERSQAIKATELASAWFGTLAITPRQRFWVRTEKDTDSFGRWLGDVWAEDEHGNRQSLGFALQRANLATTWPARWRDVFDS